MHDAAGRVRSVQATLVDRRRPELLERAFRRFGERVGFARGGGYFHIPLGGISPGEQADIHAWRIELWAEPGRVRQERRGPDTESVLVIDGDRWWEWSPAFGLRSHELARGIRHHAGLDLLDPSEFLSGFALEAAGEAVVAGRQARRVLLRSNSAWHRPFELEPGVEEGELLLDAERGLILRRTAIVDGQEASVLEVEKISYDLELPPATFIFELPSDEAAPGGAEPQLTTVDTAAALASFPVFKLGRVPPAWHVRAVYVGAVDRPTIPESVTLLYSTRDGCEHLQIRQMTREHELPLAGGERRVEHGGRSYLALGPEHPVGREPSELIFAVKGTKIRMASSALPLRRMLELADALVEA